MLSTAVKAITRLRRAGAEGVTLRILWGAFELSAAFTSDDTDEPEKKPDAVAGFVMGEADE